MAGQSTGGHRSYSGKECCAVRISSPGMLIYSEGLGVRWTSASSSRKSAPAPEP